MNAGIDYGGGTTNIDKATGIRFGVISQNEVLQAWADSAEPDYGKPRCPECNGEAVEYNEDEHEKFGRGKYCCEDYACEACKQALDSSEVFSDEAEGWRLDDGEYLATQGSDGDIFVIKSPYYTRCQFCSPCAPGAGYLMNPCEDGPKTYCFGHDFFDEGKAPYPVYSVADDTLVDPKEGA